MSGAEGQDPAGIDPIDPAVAKRCNEQRKYTNVNALSNTFNRHEEFVASDAISWR